MLLIAINEQLIDSDDLFIASADQFFAKHDSESASGKKPQTQISNYQSFQVSKKIF